MSKKLRYSSSEEDTPKMPDAPKKSKPIGKKGLIFTSSDDSSDSEEKTYSVKNKMQKKSTSSDESSEAEKKTISASDSEESPEEMLKPYSKKKSISSSDNDSEDESYPQRKKSISSSSDVIVKTSTRKELFSSKSRKESFSDEETKEEKTDEDEDEIDEYKGKDNLSILPTDILAKISSFLAAADVGKTFTSTALMMGLRSKIGIDLSTTEINLSNLKKYAGELVRYKITGLNITIRRDMLKNEDADITALLKNITTLIINAPPDKTIEIKSILGPCQSLLTLKIINGVNPPIIKMIGNKTTLRTLEINGKNFSKLGLGTSLDELKNLRSLKIKDMFIKDLSSISQLENLSYLCLDKVKIGDIKKSKLSKSLEVIELYGLAIKDINFMGNLIQLKSLTLEKCYNLRDVSNLNNIKTLQTVIIHKCPLITLNLDGCTNLRHLSLEGLEDEIKISLDGCLSLHKINIGDCEDINFLKTCENLEYLAIRAEVAEVNLNVLTNCTKLKSFLLDTHNSSLKDINVLKNCKDLTYLAISDSSISNINALSECKELETLKLGKTMVRNISSLANCTKLKTLHINSEYLKNLTPLRNCPELLDLFLTNCPIKRLFPLKSCPKLLTFVLAGCKKLTSLNGIERCTRLYNINLYACSLLSDISAISSCTSLITATFDECKIKSVSPLLKCNNLNTLTISTERNFHIENMEALKRCPNLTSINYNGKTYVFGLSKYY